MDDLPGRIKKLRNKLGLSQAALGELIGLRAHSVYRIEAGHMGPSAETLLKLARALKVDPFELAGMTTDDDATKASSNG